MSFIDARYPSRSLLWVPTRVLTSYSAHMGFLMGHRGENTAPYRIPCKFHEPTSSHTVSLVGSYAGNSIPYGLLYGPPCRKFHSILPRIGSRASFINPRLPKRAPSWVPTRFISSHTVLYGFLYGSKCRTVRLILPHMRSRVSFMNLRRPLRSPLWVSTRVITPYSVLYRFFYEPPCRKFCPI